MANISYVRKTMLEQKAPPPNSVGVMGWMRQNLFDGWLNTALTIVALFIVYKLATAAAVWLASPTWGAPSLPECRSIIAAAFGEGAHGHGCWGVLGERWKQLLFGFYPPEERWRVVLCFILLIVAVAPILVAELPRKLMWFSGLFPFLAVWLLWGGSAFGPLMILAGLGVGWAIAFIGKDLLPSVALSLLVIFGVVAWWLLAAGPIGAWLGEVIPFATLEQVPSRLFGGFMLSVTIGVTGIALSFPLGILLALGRQSDLMILKGFSIGFIEAIRGVPLITLLFVASSLLNYFMPPGTTFDIIARVMIMVTLFASAYMAEVIRGGLAAVPKGQYEAADSLGLTYAQAMRLIIMPQALKISIPGIVSTFIGLFKDTTLVSIIGLLDPVGLKTTINGDIAWTGLNWEIFGFIALIFFILCYSMSRYAAYLERKLATGHR